MRKIDLIIIHCSAVRPDQTSSAKQIDAWHRARGWRKIGYHFVIRRNGQIEPGRSEDEIGAHCLGHNQNSIGVCYEGGLAPQPPKGECVPADTRTKEQKASMLLLLKYLKSIYPDAKIVGHNKFAAKACPCFDAEKEYGLLLA